MFVSRDQNPWLLTSKPTLDHCCTLCPLQAIAVAAWCCFANRKINFKIFKVRTFDSQFWWRIMLFFLPKLFWLSSVAGTHSTGLAGVFKRCMINLCLLKIKDVCLEVRAVVNAYDHIFRGSVWEIMFLAIAIPVCWILAFFFFCGKIAA